MTDDAKIDAARALITQGMSAYVAECHPDHEGTYIQGWTITAEWTSVVLERTDRSGIITANAAGQSVSMSRGLAEFGAEKNSLFMDDEEDEDE